MATITAQNILDENNYTAKDISLVKIEPLIDNAINYINLQAGLSIGNMTGTAGSKTATVTKTQAPIIKALTSLYTRGYVDHGPNASVPDLTVSTVADDPQLNLLRNIVERGIAKLSDEERELDVSRG